jgi:hypothetical protein
MKYEAVSGEIPPDSIPSIPIVNSNARATPQRAQSQGSDQASDHSVAAADTTVSRNRVSAVK